MDTTAKVLLIRDPGRVVAHNLDHDLVAVGVSHKEAEARIVACTKSYLEFGQRTAHNDSISRPAPPELLELANLCQKDAPEPHPEEEQRSYEVKRIAATL